jgi:hypothetical protein
VRCLLQQTSLWRLESLDHCRWLTGVDHTNVGLMRIFFSVHRCFLARARKGENFANAIDFAKQASLRDYRRLPFFILVELGSWRLATILKDVTVSAESVFRRIVHATTSWCWCCLQLNKLGSSVCNIVNKCCADWSVDVNWDATGIDKSILEFPCAWSPCACNSVTSLSC